MFEFDTSGDLRTQSLTIHQPRNGYRYSIDSFLLASFVVLKRRRRVIDLGAGVGVIGMLLCARYPDCTVWGIEIQQRLVEFAGQNARANSLADRLTTVAGDFTKAADLPAGMTFDAAVSNPPYRPIGTGRPNRDDGRTVARHETAANLSDVVTAAGLALKPAGSLFLIYPAWRTADVMTTLRAGGVEPKRARFVHARQGDEAKMVMVEARRGGGTELAVMAPLFVWEAQGVYTEEAAAMVGLAPPK